MKKLLSILTLAILLTSCAPRGEYKTVDSLLAISKERYAKVASIETPAKAELAPLTEKLERVLKDQQLAAEIAATLRKLTNKAGYPSRPAMSELVLQYENIATNPSALINEASLKLLTSRTFNLLAAELQTTAFRVS